MNKEKDILKFITSHPLDKWIGSCDGTVTYILLHDIPDLDIRLFYYLPPGVKPYIQICDNDNNTVIFKGRTPIRLYKKFLDAKKEIERINRISFIDRIYKKLLSQIDF